APSRIWPATDAIIDTSSNSDGDSGGRIEGSRAASIDLPAPGEPIISRMGYIYSATTCPRQIYTDEGRIQLYPLFQPGTGERRQFPQAKREGRRLGEGSWLPHRKELGGPRRLELPGRERHVGKLL